MRQGFSLIELLIVVAITAMLATMLMVYSSQSRGVLALSVEQAKVAQIILRAKGLALAAYSAPGVKPFTQFCGYGIHFDTTAGTYEGFSYYEDPSSGGCSKNVIQSADDPIPPHMSTTRYWRAGGIIAVDAALIMSGTVTDILFVPPDPLTIVWVGTATTTVGSITLTTKDGLQTAAVVVTDAGQVTP